MRKLLAIAAALGFLGATALTPVAASSVAPVDGVTKTDELSAQKKKSAKKSKRATKKKATKKKATKAKKPAKKAKRPAKKKAPKKRSSIIEYRIAA